MMGAGHKISLCSADFNDIFMKKTVLILLFVIVYTSGFGQNTQTAIQIFRQGWLQLTQMSEDSSADSLIYYGKKVVLQYEDIVKQDSSLSEPYLLFLPYRAIAEGSEGKCNYDDAIAYYEKAAFLASNYTQQLGQLGLNMNGYISLFESLRYAYAQNNMFDKALELSKDIVETCKQYAPKKSSYEQMESCYLLSKSNKKREASEAAQISLELYSLYGNSEDGFYITTPLLNVLTYYISRKDYEEAIRFMDNHRDKVNSYLVGRDTLELSQLAAVNAYMYRAYMGVGKYNKAVNTAFLVDNYEKYSYGINGIGHAVWLHNAACAYMNLYGASNDHLYLNKADTILTEVERIWQQTPQREQIEEYATFLSTQGDFLAIKGNTATAEAKYKEATKLHQVLHAKEDRILSNLMRLAALYNRTNRTQEAISQYTALLGRYTQLKDSIGMADVCAALSIVYSKEANHHDKAEEYAVTAYNILKSHAPNSLQFANVEDNLANVYSNMGLNDRSLSYKLHSARLKQSLGMGTTSDLLDAYSSYVDEYNAIITYYPDTAKWLLDIAVPLCKKVIDDSTSLQTDKIDALKLLAKIDMLTKNYSEAIPLYRSCADLEQIRYGMKSGQYLTSLNNLAYCYLLSGDYEKSKLLTETIIKKDKSSTNYKNYENLLGAGVLSKDSVLTESVLKKLYDAELKYLTSQFLLMSSDQRQEFIDGDNVGINNLSLPALAFPQSSVCAEYAYNSALVSKGLLLSTAKEIESIASSTDDIHIKALYSELLNTRRALSNGTDSVGNERFAEKKYAIEKELIESIKSYKDFNRNLRLDWKSIKHSLKDNEIAIEFLTVDNSILSLDDKSEYYCAVLLRKEWKYPRFVKLSDKTDIDKFSSRIIESFNNGNGLKGAQWNYIGKQLYKKVWEPLSFYIGENDTIYFSPVDLLCLVPMEGLPNSDGKAINEIHVLRRLSSTRELCHSETSETFDNVVLLGGLTYTAIQDTARIKGSGKERQGWQELPATLTEVENIAAKLKERGINTITLENDKGTENAFRALSGKPFGDIHIATHGFYYNDKESNTLQFLRGIDITSGNNNHISPLKRTGLMLSGGQAAWLGVSDDNRDNDGILLSSEIASLDLHKVGLVVLSACQTGLGDVSEDGIVGLQRAFKMAGVRTLVMTLWKVDDQATSFMMINFYIQILSGKSKSESFRIAKQMVKEKFHDPFYWAPFIMLD